MADLHRASTDYKQDGTLGTLLLWPFTIVGSIFGFEIVYVEELSEALGCITVLFLLPLTVLATLTLLYNKLVRSPRGIAFATAPVLGDTVRVHAIVPRSPLQQVRKVQVDIIGSRDGREFMRRTETVANVGDPSEHLDLDLPLPAPPEDVRAEEIRWSLVITPIGTVPMTDQVVPLEQLRIRVDDLVFRG
jgi:hypothetical protein